MRRAGKYPMGGRNAAARADLPVGKKGKSGPQIRDGGARWQMLELERWCPIASRDGASPWADQCLCGDSPEMVEVDYGIWEWPGLGRSVPGMCQM